MSTTEMDNMMIKKIYEAAIAGDVNSLPEPLRDDPDLLAKYVAHDFVKDGGSTRSSPLLIACTLGHRDFVDEVIKSINPEFVKNIRDRRGRSLLHLASAKGQEDLVRLLLEVDSNLCLVQDGQGMTALHVSAMKGHKEVLRALVDENPFTAQVLTDSGETVLHVCVRYNRLEALELLLQSVTRDNIQGGLYVNKKDEEDNTILHLATAMRNVKIVRFLLRKGIDVNETNAKGQTALDVLKAIPSKLDDVKIDIEIEEVLVKYKGTRGRDKKRSSTDIQINSTRSTVSEKFSEMRSAILVLAVLLLTLTFTVGVNPPGGLWLEDDDKTKPPRVAGEAIMGYKLPVMYYVFLGFNTAGLVASSSVAMDVLYGWANHVTNLSRATIVAIRIGMYAIGIAYGTGVSVVSPKHGSGVHIVIALLLAGVPFQTFLGRKFVHYFVELCKIKISNAMFRAVEYFCGVRPRVQSDEMDATC